MGIRDEVIALKRERTITAAVELFYERGYENTTLDAVAERLGVTKPFIYAHFRSKTEPVAAARALRPRIGAAGDERHGRRRSLGCVCRFDRALALEA